MASLRIFIVFAIISTTLASYSGWNRSPNTQYHIQTDEGPERYFRYQTQSGQYRKEKRLQDGTVIGSYGWVDADGYLRLRDYIADDQGYRILKSKTVYVGPERQIQDALDISRQAPAQSGILVDPDRPQRVQSPTITVSTTPRPPPATTYRPNPSAYYTPSSTLSPFYQSSSTPYVHISPNSIDTVTKPTYIGSYPITTYRPPFRISVPNSIDYEGDDFGRRIDSDQRAPIESSQSLEALGASSNARFSSRRGDARNGYRANQLGNGYDPQFPYYDGVSVTKNGFRYYLPKQYHEENSSLDGDTRTGSFGYVDPFGIRRVIYYNTSPGSGFQLRKNNRYVGHNATPYDPRPL